MILCYSVISIDRLNVQYHRSSQKKMSLSLKVFECLFLFLFFRSLSVGTVSGYHLFALSSVESLDKIYETGMSSFLIILKPWFHVKIKLF